MDNKKVVKILIFAVLIISCICLFNFCSGYNLASKMVEKGQLSYLTYQMKKSDLSGLKRKGFCYYVENHTDINEKIGVLQYYLNNYY